MTPTKLLENLCDLKSFKYNLKWHAKVVENPNVRVQTQILDDEDFAPRKEHLYELDLYLKIDEGTSNPPVGSVQY